MLFLLINLLYKYLIKYRKPLIKGVAIYIKSILEIVILTTKSATKIIKDVKIFLV